MAADEDQVHYWNEVVGPKWVAGQERLDRLMAPLTDALLSAAAAQPGELALDVGCGCGDVSLRLAAAIGRGGYVRGIDISRPMLQRAEARYDARRNDELATIQWIAADAMTCHLPAVTQLMVSRFGVMFFADKPRAFANLRGALMEGGRFAFLTWRPCADVEWMQAPLDWIAPVLPAPDLAAGEVGPFGLADSDDTIAVLTGAGFADVTAEKIDCPLVIGEGRTDAEAVESALAMLTDVGRAAALVREAEPAPREEALALMRDALKPRAADGRVVLEGACWLYRGTA